MTVRTGGSCAACTVNLASGANVRGAGANYFGLGSFLSEDKQNRGIKKAMATRKTARMSTEVMTRIKALHYFRGRTRTDMPRVGRLKTIT